jgi:hypothetical protein
MTSAGNSGAGGSLFQPIPLLPKPHLFQSLIIFIDEIKVREKIAKN